MKFSHSIVLQHLFLYKHYLAIVVYVSTNQRNMLLIFLCVREKRDISFNHFSYFNKFNFFR